MAAFESTTLSLVSGVFSRVGKIYHGRKELTIANRDLELDEQSVKKVLEKVLPTHFKNRQEIQELKDIYRGLQDILAKYKPVRADINHKVVENNAFQIIEFKKGFVFGEPIQYVQRADVQEAELKTFNEIFYENGKHMKDVELAEDLYTAGVAFRIVFPEDDEDKPFSVQNLDSRYTFVIYTNDVYHKPIIAGYISQIDDDKYEVMAYTKSMVYYYNFDKDIQHARPVTIDLTYTEKKANPTKQIPIVEYKLNKSRMGLLELIKSQMDALNFITSADLDDIEQFIQSLLVFLNQEVDRATLLELLDLGALQIRSSDPKNPADVKLLTNKMSHSETKILYDRIYESMLTIAGVPKTSDKASGGDTGQARLLGEGWTMAEQRAKQDELAFKASETEMLKIALSVCRNKSSVPINTLKVRDIEIKFTRSRSDNMLVKTQSLMNLKQAEVHPDVAFNVVSLFSDPHETVAMSKKFFGEDFWKNGEVPNDLSKIQENSSKEENKEDEKPAVVPTEQQ